MNVVVKAEGNDIQHHMRDVGVPPRQLANKSKVKANVDSFWFAERRGQRRSRSKFPSRRNKYDAVRVDEDEVRRRATVPFFNGQCPRAWLRRRKKQTLKRGV